ncbi:MAG: ABC transporter substrate-binding protein [Acidobacteriaceae bacterium]|nr:ABC transporter substrate-binding protein [Acidobacteriaceae bacterium]MBV9442454.1 ABC transporter substrate-binding protein [Acidobacteriaceae bacterium]
MSSSPVSEIVCAHSPDSDDAFMFYGLATKKVRSKLVNFRHVLEDIESLNKKATEGVYELTAISYHAYPYVADKYVLMASGSSVGDGYGPMVVSSRKMSPKELKGKKIAIPGTMTTAFLALKLFQPDFQHVVVPFDKILNAVRDHEVDGGLVIHEGQLTYGHGGLHSVVDLGKWFKSTYGLPLPLGANALRRNLPRDIQAECSRLLRESIVYSLEHREEALNYAMQFARDLDSSLADQFVGMYVNQDTVDGGETVPKAAQKLLDLGYEAGLIPHKITVEVVR